MTVEGSAGGDNDVSGATDVDSVDGQYVLVSKELVLLEGLGVEGTVECHDVDVGGLVEEMRVDGAAESYEVTVDGSAGGEDWVWGERDVDSMGGQ